MTGRAQMAGQPTTVALADDHAVVRAGLRALLSAEPDLRVVGEAADGLQAVQVAERLRPRVLVVDVMMPGLNGLEVTRQVHQRVPQTRVIVLSMHAHEPYVLEALRRGAAGYVLKDASADELVHAVRRVAAGERYLSAPLSERAIAAYVEKAQATPATALDPFESLTTREREVLQLAAEGLGNPEIAARLSLSARTVEMHRGNLLHKLGLKTQTDVVRYALRRGLIPLDTPPAG
jgi:two-component system, NarL family, response regulator NreC